MGSASSSPSPRPPPDERTHLLAVSAEQITIARRQAALARREADAARADAANLLGEMAALEDRQKYYAALGASAFAIAVGGLGAVGLRRRLVLRRHRRQRLHRCRRLRRLLVCSLWQVPRIREACH